MDTVAQHALLSAGFLPLENSECLVTTTALGRGGFGAVVVAFHTLPDGLFERVAVKCVDLKSQATTGHVQSCITSLIREVHYHQLLADSPHVLPLKGTCWFCPRRSTVSLPMALCSGSLHDYVVGLKFQYPPGVLYMLFKQCLQALRDIHAKDVVHCDIKPDNILTVPGRTPQDTPLLLVADFGLSHHADDLRRPYSPAGTPSFMSAEAAGTAAHTHPHALDVWAMACTFFFLLSGAFPFQGDTYAAVLRSIALGVQDIDTTILGTARRNSDEVRLLVSLTLSMLCRAPEERPTAAQLLGTLNAALLVLSPQTLSQIEAQQNGLLQLEADRASGADSAHYTRMVVCRPNHAVPVYTGTDMYASHAYTGVSVQPGRSVLVDLSGTPIPDGPATAPVRTTLPAPYVRGGGSHCTASGPLLPSAPRFGSPTPLRTSTLPAVEWVRIVYPVHGFVPCIEFGQHLLHKVHGMSTAALCTALAPPTQPSLRTTPLRRSTNSNSGSPLPVARGARTPLTPLPSLPSPHSPARPANAHASPSPHRPDTAAYTPLQLPLFTDDDLPCPEASVRSSPGRAPTPDLRGRGGGPATGTRPTFTRLFSRSRSKG